VVTAHCTRNTGREAQLSSEFQAEAGEDHWMQEKTTAHLSNNVEPEKSERDQKKENVNLSKFKKLCWNPTHQHRDENLLATLVRD
jgi:hypothetical protein